MNSETQESLFSKIAVYGRMIKFSHTIFALPFALAAVVLATREHQITFGGIFFILLAMVGARSAAMGFNRLVDAKIDAKNPRTQMREIPAGVLTEKSTAQFIAISSLLFIFSAAMLGSLCFYLSFPVLALLFGYSYTKRFTAYCHLYLGFVISLSPIGAWVALTNSINVGIVFLSLALMTNIAGFDILYACQDTEFDQNEGLHSIPARFGVERALKLSTALHIGTILFFLLFHFSFGMGWFFFFILLMIGVLIVIEHRLVKPDDLTNVNIAFFHINSIISVVLFAGILINEWF